MKIEDIMRTIKKLAFSQGFYGRLYAHLIEARENFPDKWSEIVEMLEGQHFSGPVDMVMFLES